MLLGALPVAAATVALRPTPAGWRRDERVAAAGEALSGAQIRVRGERSREPPDLRVALNECVRRVTPPLLPFQVRLPALTG